MSRTQWSGDPAHLTGPGEQGRPPVLWLDLANVNRSVLHKLVMTTMMKYHVPHHIAVLFLNFTTTFGCNVSNQSGTSWMLE